MISPFLQCLPKPGDYAKAWKLLKKCKPNEEVKVPGWVAGLPGWGTQTVTAELCLRYIIRALNARINERGGLIIREHRDGEVNLQCDAQAIQNWHKSKIIIRHFRTRLAKKRFEHLIQKYDD